MLSGMFFVINEIFLKAVSEIHALGGYKLTATVLSKSVGEVSEEFGHKNVKYLLTIVLSQVPC